ncbi:hypothetical protein L596_016175 [Steinernema carpocapsae]|uniref:F-box domain-containing protein n=1 Tax=Steinernema carpocapsae TaxID=34508 RepID=A0A4U5NIE9_STECR|nr:hypothetical protein L596_016175 [Steinernema carpocapsae]
MKRPYEFSPSTGLKRKKQRLATAESKSLRLPEDVLANMFLFLKLPQQLDFASLSRTTLQSYKAHRNAITHFDPCDLKHLARFGGVDFVTTKWCQRVLDTLLETRTGGLRSVDTSAMRCKVVENLCNHVEYLIGLPGHNPNIVKIFASVYTWSLPLYVDWEEIYALAVLAPNLREIVISSDNVLSLYTTHETLSQAKSLDDLIASSKADPVEFENLRMYDETMRTRRINMDPFTHLYAYLKRGFKKLTNLRVVVPEYERQRITKP